MSQKTKIILIISFIAVSLVLIIWGSYNSSSRLVPEETITNTTSPIQIPEDAAQKFGEKEGGSEDAKTLKQQLVAPLQGNPGTVHQTTEYRIDYVPHPDTFMVEIFVVDFNNAKNLTLEWFLSKGFLKNDICNMKILFYLSNDVKEYFNQNNQTITFNPLFDGCDANF